MAYADFIHGHATMPADEVKVTQREMDTFRYLQAALAIVLPPLAVYLERGAQEEFIICLALWLLGWIPGAVYALYIVYKFEFSITTHVPPGDHAEWTKIPATQVNSGASQRRS